MYRNWSTRSNLVAHYLNWYDLEEILDYIHAYQEYILDEEYSPYGITPKLPEPIGICDINRRFPNEGFYVTDHIGPWTRYMQELKIAYNTSYNRRKFLLEPPHNRLNDEVDAFLTAINNLLAWAESGIGIFDRQKFEYRYDLKWEDSEVNADLMDIDDDDDDGSEDDSPTDGDENDNPTTEGQDSNPTGGFGDTKDGEHDNPIGGGNFNQNDDNDSDQGGSGDINQGDGARIESDDDNRTTGSVIEDESARIVSEKRLRGGPRIKFVGAKKDKPYSGGSDHHYRGSEFVRGEPSSSRSYQPSESHIQSRNNIQVNVGSHHQYENPFQCYEDFNRSSVHLYGENQNRDRLDRIPQQSIGDILQQRINDIQEGYRPIRRDTNTASDNGNLIMSDNGIEYEPSVPSSPHNPSNPVMEKLSLQEIKGQQSERNGDGPRNKGKQVDRSADNSIIQERQSSYVSYQKSGESDFVLFQNNTADAVLDVGTGVGADYSGKGHHNYGSDNEIRPIYRSKDALGGPVIINCNNAGSRSVALLQEDSNRSSSRPSTTSILSSTSRAPSVDSRKGSKTNESNDTSTSCSDGDGDGGENRDIDRARAGYVISLAYPRRVESGRASTSGSSSRNTSETASRSASGMIRKKSTTTIDKGKGPVRFRK
ncbi:unnamed protein product [Cunninghamella echinulata]